MNIYYTAQDIEELVAKGVRQLELGPNTSLTDFARETAEQLEVRLLEGAPDGGVSTPAPRPAAAPQPSPSVNQSYNKPRGCQAGGTNMAPAVSPSSINNDQDGSAPVNRLVDMMGKLIKRGD